MDLEVHELRLFVRHGSSLFLASPHTPAQLDCRLFQCQYVRPSSTYCDNQLTQTG